MRRVGVVVAWLLRARPADADDDPVVAEAMVVVSVTSMVGCVVWEEVSGRAWVVEAVVGVVKRDVLSLMATLLRWFDVRVVLMALTLALAVEVLLGVPVPMVLVRAGKLAESSAKCARFPEDVVDLEREDLVFPRDERCVVVEVLAEDHMAVRVRGVLDFCCDLEDGGGVVLSPVSTSISSVVILRGGRIGDTEMSSAFRTRED